VPLVLHGASGLGEAVVKQCLAVGRVGKFNVNSEVRKAYLNTLKDIQPGDELTEVIVRAEDSMREVIEAKISLFGSLERGVP